MQRAAMQCFDAKISKVKEEMSRATEMQSNAKVDVTKERKFFHLIQKLEEQVQKMVSSDALAVHL